MEQDGIKQGLVCVLSCVEPCQTYELRKNHNTKHLELRPARRKCLFLYFYFVDREFGLMHVRLQTWLPMTIQMCLNGREYLARRLDKAGIGYKKEGNCFTHIDDLRKAQQMMDDLEQRNWPHFLSALARRFNPWLSRNSELEFPSYYWTIRESEYATDVMFIDEASLNAIYPELVNHTVQHFSCRDVMRFMGRRFHRGFDGEVKSDVKHRVEGVRMKHWVDENSIKMYDKQGSVLRIETTINNPKRFNVRRKATRNGELVIAWFRMRKSVADIPGGRWSVRLAAARHPGGPCAPAKVRQSEQPSQTMYPAARLSVNSCSCSLLAADIAQAGIAVHTNARYLRTCFDLDVSSSSIRHPVASI